MEQVLLTSINSPSVFSAINIPQNVVDVCAGDVDTEQLSTQLSMLPAVLQAHNRSAEKPISRVTKVAKSVQMLLVRHTIIIIVVIFCSWSILKAKLLYIIL